MLLQVVLLERVKSKQCQAWCDVASGGFRLDSHGSFECCTCTEERQERRAMWRVPNQQPQGRECRCAKTCVCRSKVLAGWAWAAVSLAEARFFVLRIFRNKYLSNLTIFFTDLSSNRHMIRRERVSPFHSAFSAKSVWNGDRHTGLWARDGPSSCRWFNRITGYNTGPQSKPPVHPVEAVGAWGPPGFRRLKRR